LSKRLHERGNIRAALRGVNASDGTGGFPSPPPIAQARMPRHRASAPGCGRSKGVRDMGNKNAREADDRVDDAGEALDDGDAEHALELAQTALVLDPKNSGAAIAVSEALCTLGRFSDAVPVLEKALKVHPHDGELFWTAAAVYLQTADDEHDHAPL